MEEGGSPGCHSQPTARCGAQVRRIDPLSLLGRDTAQRNVVPASGFVTRLWLPAAIAPSRPHAIDATVVDDGSCVGSHRRRDDDERETVEPVVEYDARNDPSSAGLFSAIWEGRPA